MFFGGWKLLEALDVKPGSGDRRNDVAERPDKFVFRLGGSAVVIEVRPTRRVLRDTATLEVVRRFEDVAIARGQRVGEGMLVVQEEVPSSGESSFDRLRPGRQI